MSITKTVSKKSAVVSRPETKRLYIGRGWLNFIRRKDSSATEADAAAFKKAYHDLVEKFAKKGVVLQTRILIDNGVSGEITKDSVFELWGNKKREDHEKDADVSFSTLVPAE